MDEENLTGHTQDAEAARNQAIETYIAYRRDGGDSHGNQIQLFSLVHQAVQQNGQEHAARQLNDLLEPRSTAVYGAHPPAPSHPGWESRSRPRRRPRAGLYERRRAVALARNTRPGTARPAAEITPGQ